MTKEILLIIVAIVFSSAFIFACAWIGGPCNGCDDNLNASREAFSTETENLESLQKPGSGGYPDRLVENAKWNAPRPTFRPDVQSISRGDL